MESRVVVSSVCQNKILDVFATLREETHLSWVVQVSCVYHETGHFSVGAAQARREDAFVAELGENGYSVGFEPMPTCCRCRSAALFFFASTHIS